MYRNFHLFSEIRSTRTYRVSSIIFFLISTQSSARHSVRSDRSVVLLYRTDFRVQQQLHLLLGQQNRSPVPLPTPPEVVDRLLVGHGLADSWAVKMSEVFRGKLGAGGGRKRRWKLVSRFFSCVGLGGEAASSIDVDDAPTTPPVDPSSRPAAADPPPSTIPKESAIFFAAPERDLPTFACDSSETASAGQPEPEEAEAMTLAAVEEKNGDRSTPAPSLTASSDSLYYVADYVEHCRSIRRHDGSFADVFRRVPGCRPSLLLSSHAAHLRNLAPWITLSYEVETPSYGQQTKYDVDDFGNVDVTCQLYNEEALGATDLPSQQPRTQVTLFSSQQWCS